MHCFYILPMAHDQKVLMKSSRCRKFLGCSAVGVCRSRSWHPCAPLVSPSFPRSKNLFLHEASCLRPHLLTYQDFWYPPPNSFLVPDFENLFRAFFLVQVLYSLDYDSINIGPVVAPAMEGYCAKSYQRDGLTSAIDYLDWQSLLGIGAC